MNDYCYDDQFSCLAGQLAEINSNLVKILEYISETMKYEPKIDETEEDDDLPHNCKVGYLHISSDEDGRLWVMGLRHPNFDNLPLFREQVDFCPVCGFESPMPICKNLCRYPRF